MPDLDSQYLGSVGCAPPPPFRRHFVPWLAWMFVFLAAVAEQSARSRARRLRQAVYETLAFLRNTLQL